MTSSNFFSYLPLLNAVLNVLSATLLTSGFIFIRRKNISAHKKCMLGAVSVSIIFLISYVMYHYTYGTTVFDGQGWRRIFYFGILISHTALAILIIPLVVITVRHAFGDRLEKHKKMARVTLPIWLYVSITGVMVYAMLYPIFQV